ncbi:MULTISPECIES: HNH endonuclease [Serratia]|uniref:Putative HNH nuclease YajD n=2 Tax=Serratia TaxID=613 RepID=A0ABD5BD13_SERMA|nr:HNH endonuclease [Serratia marcescens]AYJ92048.1 HNH endonuclease [Klebsiella pneumoniae]MBH2935571.1 HNH endonuclease [Serratia marcescens]MBN3978292.1 HNH endonuclease [Serratia marcescens]MDQ9391186.1 HNH endonuclease [Serratia marcescens]MDQ9409475.1 HNH endonuclease [Serratia marcescens]
MASNSPWHYLYNTKRWYRLRYHQLQKQPLCEFHLKRDQVVSASIVDHVKPHKGDEELFHDPDNLQSLCKRCHDSVKQRMEKGGTVTEFDNEGRVIW